MTVNYTSMIGNGIKGADWYHSATHRIIDNCLSMITQKKKRYISRENFKLLKNAKALARIWKQCREQSINETISKQILCCVQVDSVRMNCGRCIQPDFWRKYE